MYSASINITYTHLFPCCCCSVAQSYPNLSDSMDCSTPGFSVHHYLPEFAQTHAHWLDDAIQPSYPLSPSSPSALNLSQHLGLFQWASCPHQMTKIQEFPVLEHQSFQWVFRVDFPYNGLVWSPCCPRDSQESSPALSGFVLAYVSRSNHLLISWLQSPSTVILEPKKGNLSLSFPLLFAMK